MPELTETEKYRQGISDARTEAERLRTLATDESVTAWIRAVIRDLNDADRWIAETREGFRFAMANISISDRTPQSDQRRHQDTSQGLQVPVMRPADDLDAQSASMHRRSSSDSEVNSWNANPNPISGCTCTTTAVYT
jgi:hypothetical protein